MRIFASYHKGEPLRFLSHLDIQRLLQRALRRAEIPVAYSQGFNPHPLLAFASALPVGYTGSAEWADIRLEEDMDPQAMVERMNGVFPDGFCLGEAMIVPDTLPTLTALTAGAGYQVVLSMENPAAVSALQDAADALLAGPVVVSKRTKAGVRDVDIRPQVIGMEAEAGPGFRIEGVLNVDGSLSVELLMQALFARLDRAGAWRVHRTGLYFTDTFPLLPQRAGVKEPE